MPGRIYDSEREYALQENMDIQYVTQLGHRAAVLAGQRLASKVLSEFKRGLGVNAALAEGIKDMAPIISDAMFFARLKGMDRGRKVAEAKGAVVTFARVPLKVRQYNKSVNFLLDRLNLTPAQMNKLKGQADQHVLRVLSGVNGAAQKRLQKTIAQAVAKQWSTTKTINALRDDFDSLGITERNSFQVEAIVRTQTKLAYSAGQRQVDQQPDVADRLWGYKYVTMRDDRVRPEHALLEGVTAPKEDGVWDHIFPPNGWACRCVVARLYREQKVHMPPPGAGPDPGFDFDPGLLLSPV